jgi:hypothetical protein
MGELTDQLRSFLGGRRYAVLATHDPDGGINLTPIWFLFEDDRFHFASSSGSPKADTDGVAVVDRAGSGLAGALVPGGRHVIPRRSSGSSDLVTPFPQQG